MKQKLVAAIIGATMVIAPLPALTADTAPPANPAPQQAQAKGPLAPGKAAGVRQAQGEVDNTDILYGLGIGAAIGLAIYAFASGDSGGGGSTVPTPSPAPSTTTTTP